MIKIQLLTAIATATLLAGCLNTPQQTLSQLSANHSNNTQSVSNQQNNISNSYWQLTSATLNGKVINTHAAPITLHIENGTFSGQSGVNNYRAQAQINNGNLQISDIITTRMAASVSKMRLESNYLSALRQVKHFDRSNDSLTLSGDNVKLQYQLNNTIH